MNQSMNKHLMDRKLHLLFSEDAASEDVVWEAIQRFSSKDTEGWFCFTSSLWLLLKENTIETLTFVDGHQHSRGRILSCELHTKVDGVHQFLSVRHNGAHYEIKAMELRPMNMDGMPVKVRKQSFFGAVSQKTNLKNLKLNYYNCWGKVPTGEPPHQVEVYQPLVGVFTGFHRGEK